MVDEDECAPYGNEQFISQPFICGALGPDEHELWAALRAESPADVVLLRESISDRFAASSSSVGLEPTPTGWCWGRYIARTERPSDPVDASQQLGLAGYWATSTAAILHVDGLGMQDIFIRTVGRTTYFCNRIAPLAKLGRELLNVNWAGWQNCFYFRMFTGADTPFAEITRMTPGERLIYSDRGLRQETELPRWLTDPSEDCSRGELVDAFIDTVPRSFPIGADITLSGGLDSRLILSALLSHSRSSIRARSTYHEDGSNADVRIARHIARTELLLWRAVEYSVSEWRQYDEFVVRRLEHMTVYHGWYMPLARTIRHSRGPLLDGLAGDVLLRYHDRVPAGRQSERIRRIWTGLGGNNESKAEIFHPHLMEHWSNQLFEEWCGEMSRWHDHRYGESLIRLFTRTSTGIAMAPFRLFGPERNVLTPFLDPVFVRTVLSTKPLASFKDRDLRPRLLSKLAPNLAELESTSALTKSNHWQERGRTDIRSLRGYVDKIQTVPYVGDMFANGFFDHVAENDGTSADVSFALRTGAMMADWLNVWENRLNLTSSPT